jgi:hypothetical protein
MSLKTKNMIGVVGGMLGIAYACRYILNSKISENTDFQGSLDVSTKTNYFGDKKTSDALGTAKILLNYTRSQHPVFEDNVITLPELLTLNNLKRLVYHKSLYSLGLATDIGTYFQNVSMSGYNDKSQAYANTIAANRKIILDALKLSDVSEVPVALKAQLASAMEAVIQKVKDYPENKKSPMSEKDHQRLCAAIAWTYIEDCRLAPRETMAGAMSQSLRSAKVDPITSYVSSEYEFLADMFFRGAFNQENPNMTNFLALGKDKNDFMIIDSKAMPTDPEGIMAIADLKKYEPLFFKGVIFFSYRPDY